VKHLLLLLVVVAVGYGAWNLASPIERRHGLRLITRHGIRLGSLVLLALALLAAAYYLPATGIL
jgi:hypothetical protein